jgi:hypothetical protein
MGVAGWPMLEEASAMIRFSRRLLQVWVLAAPVSGVAAPFCIYNESIPPQCMYYDAGSCNQRAAQIGGYCSVNTKEARLPANGRWCMVTSSMVTMCAYADVSTCQQDAQRQGAACVKAPAPPGKASTLGTDPFASTRPY